MSTDMQQGNGHPIKLLVLAGPDIQGSARWSTVPTDALPKIVSDPYSAAVEVVRGSWDALLVDPGFLTTPVMSLIEGAVRTRGLAVWMFEGAANPAMFHLALKAGAVPLSKVKPATNGKTNGHTNGHTRQEPERRATVAATVQESYAIAEEPLEAMIGMPPPMSDEEAIRAALGYGNDLAAMSTAARKKRQVLPGLDTIVENGLNPEQPVLTDAELRALLGEDEG